MSMLYSGCLIKIYGLTFIYNVRIRHVHYFVLIFNCLCVCQTALNTFKNWTLAAIGPALYEFAESPKFRLKYLDAFGSWHTVEEY